MNGAPEHELSLEAVRLPVGQGVDAQTFEGNYPRVLQYVVNGVCARRELHLIETAGATPSVVVNVIAADERDSRNVASDLRTALAEFPATRGRHIRPSGG